MVGRPLTHDETEYVLSAFPSGSSVIECSPLTSRGLVALPRRVDVKTPHSEQVSVVLRSARYWPGVFIEAELFPVLAALGLPVPHVLAAPRVLQPEPGSKPHPVLLLSMLPGRPLDELIIEDSAHCKLLLECRRQLHALTVAVAGTPVGQSLPRISLESVLWEVSERASAWSGHPLYEGAVDKLLTHFPTLREPLVFSNGDIQPGNFLATPPKVTGFLDFEYAAFEDPLMAIAKRKVYDVGTQLGFDLADMCLAAMGRSQAELAPRVALRSLVILDRLAREGDSSSPLEAHVLRLLAESLDSF